MNTFNALHQVLTIPKLDIDSFWKRNNLFNKTKNPSKDFLLIQHNEVCAFSLR